MTRRWVITGLVAAAVALPTFAEAQRRPALRDQLLAAHTVNFRVDRDVVRVGTYEGTFRGIRLEVKRHPVEFLDLKIVFGNGQMQDASIRSVIPAGGQTRIIDLPGSKRFIKEIRMVYKTIPNFRGDPAIVEVHGIR